MKKTTGCRVGKCNFKIMIGFVLVLAAVWCFCGCGANKTKVADLSPMVRIDLGSSTASGVIYERTEEELVIVTAGHVLKGHVSMPAGQPVTEGFSVSEESSVLGEPSGPEESSVLGEFSGTAESSVIESHVGVKVILGDSAIMASEVFVSENSETAFITIPIATIPEEILEKCQAAPRDQQLFDQLQEEDRVVLKGFSADGELLEISGTLIYSWIYAEDFAQYMMLVDGESFPGMSGGGVFDVTGNLVGIICGVNDAGESAAVPLSIILAEYMQAYPDRQ